MNPVPDDILLPCHWLHEELGEDRMEFRRDDDRFAISAVRSEKCPPLPDLVPGHGWKLRCRQRAGEASGTTTVGYVITRDVALDTVLRYMERINEAIEGDVDLSPGAMIDLLAGRTATGDPDDRERTTTTGHAVEELSP